jgi:hypothetical protein
MNWKNGDCKAIQSAGWQASRKRNQYTFFLVLPADQIIIDVCREFVELLSSEARELMAGG